MINPPNPNQPPMQPATPQPMPTAPIGPQQSQPYGQPIESPFGLPTPNHNGNNPEPITYSDGFPLFIPDEMEQRAIVAKCNAWKQDMIINDKEKKIAQQRAYAYTKSKWFDKRDLLPTPASEGQDRDNNQDRPQIFMPLSREQFKLLYANLKLTFFSNDEDYFRIKGKTAQAAILENDLTDAAKYVFKQANMTRMMGDLIADAITFGGFAGYPTFTTTTNYDWQINWQTQQYEPKLSTTKKLYLEAYNPMHFYIDSIAKTPQEQKWGYFAIAKKTILQNKPYYFNKDKIKDFSTKSIMKYDLMEGIDISYFNETNPTYLDVEDNVWISHYYFPYLATEKREYHNILVSVVNNQLLVECRPNMTPGGEVPVIYWPWLQDKDSPYGTGPMEDIADIQRLYNIIYNYSVEVLSRIGNRFFAKEGVDFSSFFGAAAGVAFTEDPHNDIVPVIGDYAEIKFLADWLGTIKAEGQMIAGSQDPFQGSSQIDFKKTATEINVLQENSVSVAREVVENLSMGFTKIMERFMMLLPDVHPEPFQVRVDTPMQGTRYVTADFSVLRSGDYTIELIGSNPAQSKQAQVESLKELITGLMNNPQAIMYLEPLIIEAANLEGIKDMQNLIDQVKAKFGQMQQQQAQAQQAQQQQQMGQNVPGLQ